MLLRCLEIFETAFGPEHPKAGALYQLAGSTSAPAAPPKPSPCSTARSPSRSVSSAPTPLRRWLTLPIGPGLPRHRSRDQAEPLLHRALAIHERGYGPEHLYVSAPLSALGRLYRNSGRYAEAEPLLLRAVAIRERAHGAEHPDLVSPLNILAMLYRENERATEAEPLLRRCLEIIEKVPRPDHPDLISVLENYTALLDELVAAGKLPNLEPRPQRSANNASRCRRRHLFSHAKQLSHSCPLMGECAMLAPAKPRARGCKSHR